MISEKVFMEKFICPHKEAAPKLAQDYAAACRGKMPTRFRFT
jgi:mTERF domain-containing protein